MARCRCQGERCSCALMPGANVQISGSGTIEAPWVVTSLASTAGALYFDDSDEVDFVTTGFGTTSDPLHVTATLPWVNHLSGNVGDVMTRQADGTWLASPPIVVGSGVVVVGRGLTGDGTVALPLKVSVCTYGELKAMCGP